MCYIDRRNDFLMDMPEVCAILTDMCAVNRSSRVVGTCAGMALTWLDEPVMGMYLVPSNSSPD